MIRAPKLATALFVSWMLLPVHACSAASFEELDSRISACNLVLKNVFEMPDRGIPKNCFKDAEDWPFFPG